MIVGYARVSTTDQNLDRQIEAFNKFGVQKIYSDKMSGKDFERTNYIKMLQELQSGDILVIKSIDRLGRNYDLIIDEWRKITHQIKADIVVLDMPLLDTRDKDKGLTGKFISDIVLQILSYVAETERNNIKQRQAEGIRIAKEKGVHIGRPKVDLPNNFEEIAKYWYENKISLLEASRKLNMSKSSFCNYANKLGYVKRKNTIQKNIEKPEKFYYQATGEFVHKTYSLQKDLLNDIKISPDTLNKYFKGQETIIQKMGIKIEKLKRSEENE